MKITGKVISGIQQAREMLGIKTANIEVGNVAVDDGIYAAKLKVAGQQYQGVCFIGKAHLVEGTPQRMEVFLFDYKGSEFYGKQVVLSLEKKLREPREFKTKEQAKSTITKDINLAKEYFTKE